MEQKLWFWAKSYGWGWYPSSWEGWMVMLGFVILFVPLMVFAPTLFQTAKGIILFYGSLVLFLVVLFSICWVKGERPRWQWGK